MTQPNKGSAFKTNLVLAGAGMVTGIGAIVPALILRDPFSASIAMGTMAGIGGYTLLTGMLAEPGASLKQAFTEAESQGFRIAAGIILGVVGAAFGAATVGELSKDLDTQQAQQTKQLVATHTSQEKFMAVLPPKL